MAEERSSAEPQQTQEAPAPAAPVAAPVAPTTSFGGASSAGAIGAALRSGTMAPSNVLALQRMAGNQAVAGAMIMRDPPTGAPPAQAPAPQANQSPAITVELPEALADKMKLEAGKASWVKGSVQVKGEVQFIPVEAGVKPGDTTVSGSTGSQGVKVEIEKEAPKWANDLAKSLDWAEIKEGLTFECGLKKLEVSIGLNGKLKSKYDWVRPIVEGKVIGVGVEWEKIQEAQAGALELSGGFSGEGKVQFGGVDYIAKPKITITGNGGINWAKVATEVAKRGFQEGAKGAAESAAGEVIAVDAAAVGAGAAAILVPLAAAVAMGYGAFQAMKNAKTAQEAVGLGVGLRDQANLWAKNYARTLTGHGKADGPGAADAEAQIKALMEQHHSPRELVIAMIKEKRGNYDALRQEAHDKIKPKLYDEAVKHFEEGHQADFGLIESIGEDWGMRGVFRRDLKQILMSDTAVGGG
jgi:hypothetical protein